MAPKTVVVLGRSGSGKGTQVRLLEEKLRPCFVVVAGDLFRGLAEGSGLVGRKVKEILEVGGLPPEWLAEFLWQRELVEKLQGQENVIFDGSPRRVGEAVKLDEVWAWLGRKEFKAVLVDVTEEEAATRLLKRSRADDDRSAIQARLEWFNKIVVPVVDYYEKSGRLIRVDGLGTVAEVFERILRALDLT